MELAVPDCPKRMVYGPCGGVRPAGECEVDDRACPFVTMPMRRWDGPATAEPARWPTPGRTTPVVITDLSTPAFDLLALRRITAILAPAADGLLVGEHQRRPDFPPTLLAAELLEAGARPWITLSCRDRNRVVLEQELQGLAALDVEGVLCVTGDARGPSVRPDVTQVFDLDGTRLAAIAASAGLRVAVPESPAAYPERLRPGRVVQKQRAGASVCILNHTGRVAQVARFVADARTAGATIPFVASVGVVTDERSAAVLAGFPGLVLDRASVDAVLGSADPVAAGIEAAVEEARLLMAVDGVVGVNLSGLASGAGPIAAAEIKAEIARRVRQL